MQSQLTRQTDLLLLVCGKAILQLRNTTLALPATR
jgi:hypothetical protein